MANKVPLRMKLFSTWETDRTTPNCTTRLCVLTVSRVTISKILGNDLSSIIVSVRMDSSKRTLKSNELQLQTNGLLDTELELSFSLQYLHYLKRDSNRLNILLQRKNKYKNRTMLGYKTIAEGVIQMDQVLQKEITDLELDLFSNYKDKNAYNSPVGKIFIGQVSSLPVDHDAKHNTYPTDRSGMYYSDGEDEGDSSSNGDEEVDLYDTDAIRTKTANPRHNLKQRFVSLLRKFKMTDSEGTRAALDDTGEIQALFNELESLSCEDDDSANEQDTMSISSTPKPCLRPFFSSSRSLIDSATTSVTILDKKLRTISDNNSNNEDKDKNLSGSDNNGDQNLTDPDAQSDPQITSSPPREKDKKLRLFKTNHSTSSNSIKKKSSILTVDNTTTELHTTTIRKEFIEKVNDVFKFDENNIPEYIMLVFSSEESNTSRLIKNLESFYTLLNPDSRSEIKFVFSTLFSRLYKYCSHNNNNSRNWTSIKIILIGNNVLNSSCLRNYVDLLSTRPAEWQNLLQFFIVPLGNNFIAKYLAQIDLEYDLLFPHEIHLRPDDFLISLNNYIHSNNGRSIQIPIAEALLTCQDESSQVFIPFVHNVRIGSNEICSLTSIEVNDDNSLMTSQLLNLLPLLNQSSVVPVTPPSSPNIQNRDLAAWDPPLELQLEYWPMIKTDNKNEKSKLDSKISIKGIFRNIYVTRPILNSTFTISFNLKEKKQKIMRLGKKKEKEKDVDVKLQIVENVSRLICSAKTQNNGMKVSIDGVEVNGVKFFQLSSMWPTHIKFLNISLMGLDVKI